MKTTLVIRGSRSGARPSPRETGGPDFARSIWFRRKTCSTIWAAVKLPLTPFIPLAQNLQPTGQPTCELTQAVRRSASGIITVSALEPSSQDKNNFSVPSELDCRLAIAADVNAISATTFARSGRDKLVIFSAFETFLL